VVLAREAADREAVKLGLAMLGTVRGPDDRELLTALGVHDEFTLFSVVALANQAEDPELAVWNLAKRVDGWGRIHAVERLAKARRQEVRAWLLREGFRNAVMNEYLAYTCAMAGELHVALRVEPADAALLHGAAGIFVALCNGGPAQDMSDYPHADAAVEAWLDQVERGPADLDRIEALDALEKRPEIAAALKTRIASCRSSPAVDACIEAGLAAEDPVDFRRADQAAHRRGRSTFARLEEIVRGATGDHVYALQRLIEDANDSNVDRALEAAGSRIDLAQIATGPSDSMGIGAEFAPHRLLDFVLQDLGRFPGKGAAFIAAGLRSPVTRNRNMALRAAAAWGRTRWPQELESVIERGASIEPNEDLARRFSRVSAGQPFDDPEA
jgi:hypothetical protein